MGKKNETAAGRLRAVKTWFRGTRLGDQKYRSLRFAGMSCVSNTVIGLGKLVMGIISLSFFTCVSGCYTLGTVGAKSCAMVGLIREQDRQMQVRCYKLAGIVLTIASLLYIAYSVRVCFVPPTARYHQIVAISIAAFTCAELIINIRGVVKERHNHALLIHAIKMINLASSAICLVLTQTALLSFALEGENIMPWANGLMGVLMGTAAAVIGMVMIVRSYRMERNKEEEI